MKLQSRKQIIDRLEKSIKKTNPLHPEYLYGYIAYGAQYIFCDGYRLAVLNRNFGYDTAELNDFTTFENIAKASHPKFKGGNAFEYDDDLSAVKLDVERLYGHIQQYPAKPYQVGNAWFNPHYLKDAVELICREALKTTQVLELYHDGNEFHPLWLFNADGEAIMVLPVNTRTQN